MTKQTKPKTPTAKRSGRATKIKPVPKPRSKAAANKHATKKSPLAKPGSGTFLYVFGIGDGGKPRGARFPEAQSAQISGAVGELKLAMCTDTSARLTELGMKLPLGRVFARGKAFIPFIQKELFEQLRDAQYGPISAPAGQEIAKEDVFLPDGPTTWDEVVVGSEVIGHDSLDDGWWESRIVNREGDIVTLEWTDYPHEGLAKRHITSIALRHPGPIKSPYR